MISSQGSGFVKTGSFRAGSLRGSNSQFISVKDIFNNPKESRKDLIPSKGKAQFSFSCYEAIITCTFIAILYVQEFKNYVNYYKILCFFYIFCIHFIFHVFFVMIIYFLIFGFILKVNKCILWFFFSLSNLNLQIKNIEILYNPFVLAS